MESNNINLLTYNILNQKIIDYENTNNYDNNLIIIKNFKLSHFWEICNIKNNIVCFLCEDIKSNNLTKRIEKEDNIFIFPKNTDIYQNNKNNIKFTNYFTLEEYEKFILEMKNIKNDVIFYNNKYTNNINIFKKYNLKIFGYINHDSVIKVPNLITIKNLAIFLESNGFKMYYYGNRINLPDYVEYCFINNNKISQNYLDIEDTDMKKIFKKQMTYIELLNRKRSDKIRIPKTLKLENVNELNLDSKPTNFLHDPSKNRPIHTKNLKKYLEEINTVEYPIRKNILKINFIIKTNPILDLNNASEFEWIEYNLMFNLLEDYLVYYNSILLNDKIDKNNLINQKKFLKEFNDIKKNSFLYFNNIIKCPKDKFDLIFYIGNTKNDIEVYDKLPYPKILSGPIIPDYWNDDRHLIAIPSNNLLDVISSGIIKYENESIKLPKRFIIKSNFLGPNIHFGNLHNNYFSDYIILVNTNNKDSIELSLLEDLIDNIRIQYNKEIVLLTTCEYKTDKKWIHNVKFSDYVGKVHSINMVIILDDIWKEIYSYTYLLLESINCEIPILISESPIINELFINYSGLFKCLQENLIGINNIKLFFEKKITSLISDDVKELEFIKAQKQIWNNNIKKSYKRIFDNIIAFLNNKNYKRSNILEKLDHENGINFYYHENINELNMSDIYNNIDDFLQLIKPYKKILLISSDYPGYGGASSLNNEIAKCLELRGHICRELYYLFSSINDKEANKIIHKYQNPNKFDFENLQKKTYFYNNIRVTKFKDLEDDLNNIDFEPDLVILKNHLNGIILPAKYKNIFYLVAGIYQNKLNKFFYNLSLHESEQFVNKKVIELLMDSRVKGLSNSLHTKEILDKHFNIKTELYYVNFLPYYPRKLPKENIAKREYDYGIICSDFTRPIKNLKQIIDDLDDKVSKTDKVIFIGKNCKKFKLTNCRVSYIDLIPNFLVEDYLKKIKNVIINSYYESNANLAIQAKFNGCNVIRHPISKYNNKLKILITSTQKPGYGGSATNAYKLCKWLRDNNFNVGILFYNKEKADIINTDKIEGCFTLRDVYQNKDFYNINDKNKIKNDIVNYLKGYPDLIFAFNYYTPILTRKLFPFSYIYYYVVGNPVLTIGSESIISQNISISKFLDDKYELISFDEDIYELEKESIKVSNEILIDQGELNIKTISKIHPEFKYLFNNYYNYGINILLPELKLHNNIKEFELVAVSSNWERLVKNPKFIYDIYKYFPQYRKLVIGKNSHLFNSLPNITCVDLIDYDELQEYLSKSKLLVIPSFTETGPNTMIEAFVNNCQVITSKNIGYLRYLQKYHICEDVYDLEEWLTKINYIINNFNNIPVPKISAEDDKIKYIENINSKNYNRKMNVLVVCGDKPYYGGAATNSYNLIKLLKTEKYNATGLFISYQNDGLEDPDDLGNVFHIFLDNNIEEKLNKWKDNYKINFDIIFCKNYKVFTIIKNLFPYIPIIYSPSGLRQLTANITKKKLFYNDLKKNLKLNISNDNYVEKDNIYDFIMTNDKLLENYALTHADYILPNSNITGNIIKEYYDHNIKNKMLEAIYLSNIQFIEKTNFNFSKRKYDFAFIATNWKRATKNIWLVKSLIKEFKNTKYKLLVIGNNHDIKNVDDYENLTVMNHVLRDEMINLYQNIKAVVVTSFYESNPNVLMEGIYCGCNVITSLNTGNAENIRRELVVKKPHDIRSWLSCMEIGAKKSFPYMGPSIDLVKNEFISLLKYNSLQQEAVGVYKITAKWDLETKIKPNDKFDYVWIDKDKFESIEEHKGRRTDIFSNIYMHMFQKMCEKLGFKHNHYLFVDESIEQNIRMKWKNINIWILRTKEDVMLFTKAKFYFVRGNYQNFYSKLIHSNAYSIYYSATSFKYDYNIKLDQKIIKRDLEFMYKRKNIPQIDTYNLVLHHEDNNYHNQFKNNKRMMFKKFCLDNTFKNLNIERKYNIIFVGDAIQYSKNHGLMFDFIKYCDINKIDIKIAYVSNKDVLKEKYDNYYESDKVDFYYGLNPDQLCELYNKSKVNLLLSSRDCVPRVIVESIACGCYNVTTDILSDGKFYYDNICGELLTFPYGEVKLIKSGLLTYLSNPVIFKKIVKISKNTYNHEKISNHGNTLYNIDNTINDIIKNI